MRPKIAIIDYGMGNLFSVQRACEEAGLLPVVTSRGSVIADSAAIILPGVGAFGDAMDNLRSRDLIGPIKKFIESGKLFMGICLGMQLLMSQSEEFGLCEGLDIVKGIVVKFPSVAMGDRTVKVPQVDWNQIFSSSSDWLNSPLKDISEGEFMYFVHSYYTIPEDSQAVLSVTTYGQTKYCSSILSKNIFACQFHPEKSADKGIKIYRNFSSMLSKNK